MPTLVNNLRAIRGPVTAVPVTAGSGIEISADTQNNQIVISSNLEAGSGIEIVDDNGKAKIINSDNAQALPIIAGTGVKLSVVNNQVVVSADETVLWSGSKATAGDINLSEAFTNFEIVRFFFKDNERHLPHVYDVSTDVSTTSTSWIGISITVCGNDSFFTLMNMSFTYNNDKNVLTMPSLGSCAVFAMSNSTWTKLTSSVFSPPFEITKIVGINRLSN
ncbi:hypothetical protein [Ruminobacter amylophilus]|uniref:hypothetical protein n=1 Tax=Ruminobacter amylophilus TaxID=867 RepID=UPI00386E3A67